MQFHKGRKKKNPFQRGYQSAREGGGGEEGGGGGGGGEGGRGGDPEQGKVSGV